VNEEDGYYSAYWAMSPNSRMRCLSVLISNCTSNYMSTSISHSHVFVPL